MKDYENDSAFINLRSTVATRTRRLLVWCGAGLSAPAGIPTWNALQRRLETALATKLQTMDMPERQRLARVASIKKESNPWVAFQRLQGDLGITTFRECVRGALSKSVSVQIPPAYLALWKLRPYGVITLNLDRLVTRAATESAVNGLIEFKGKELGSYSYTLSSPRPFICNIHGIEEDVDSWVFTQADLKSLSEAEPYKNYINAVLLSSAVVFLGITADDVAVGGHLERLVSLGIKSQTHYWITDRRDSVTDQWAEKNGISVIRYKPSAIDHPELVDLLEQLASYVQPDSDPEAPVSLELELTASPIPACNELIREDPEKIRSELNAHATFLLKENDQLALDKFEEFSKKYDRAIHSAWYVSTAIGENKFLGYDLVAEVAKGAFGAVYRAYDKDGQECAIKILHAEIRKERELLNAFRRGVRSMKILGQKEVTGMVKYRAASEFPATLIMDWVNGPNLNNVVESGNLSEWDSILEVSYQLSGIIATAHALPERVLHRDIRPSNIMIEDYWESDLIRLVVLDFDLSWHRGSVEKSVIFGSQLSGYLAPEQIQARKGVSTQHASVDSYGIGMTLFFIISRRNPKPGEHAYGNWKATVDGYCGKISSSCWKSTGRRIARLVIAATQDRQEQRWDVSQIRSELNRLKDASNSPSEVKSAELIAEELAMNCHVISTYTWNDSNFSAEYNFNTGLEISLTGEESTHQVVFTLKRIANEATDRNRMGDLLNRARDSIRSVLKDAGWEAFVDVGQGSLTVIARIDCSTAAADIAGSSDSIRRAIERSALH